MAFHLYTQELGVNKMLFHNWDASLNLSINPDVGQNIFYPNATPASESEVFGISHILLYT